MKSELPPAASGLLLWGGDNVTSRDFPVLGPNAEPIAYARREGATSFRSRAVGIALFGERGRVMKARDREGAPLPRGALPICDQRTEHVVSGGAKRLVAGRHREPRRCFIELLRERALLESRRQGTHPASD